MKILAEETISPDIAPDTDHVLVSINQKVYRVKSDQFANKSLLQGDAPTPAVSATDPPSADQVNEILNYARKISNKLVDAGIFALSPPKLTGFLIPGKTEFKFASDSGLNYVVSQNGVEIIYTGSSTVTNVNDASEITITLDPAATMFSFNDDSWYSINMKSIGNITILYENFRNLFGLMVFECDADTSKVTSFDATWTDCGFSSFPLIDTISAVSLNAAWMNCANLTSFPLINTKNVQIFSNIFRGCAGLTEVPVLDYSEALEIRSHWYACSGITYFPSMTFPKVTDISAAFGHMYALTAMGDMSFPSVLSCSNAWSDSQALVCFKSLLFGPAMSPTGNAFWNADAIVQPPKFGTDVRNDYNATPGSWTNPNECP